VTAFPLSTVYTRAHVRTGYMGSGVTLSPAQNGRCPILHSDSGYPLPANLAHPSLTVTAIAAPAGGDWPDRARVAAVALVADSNGGSHSLGVQLLTDLKTVFGNEDALSTESILTLLHGLEESPWGDLRGKPLDSRGLSYRLRQYEVKPTTVRIGGGTPKGYRREDLHDSWVRYVPVCDSPLESATSATSATTTPGEPVCDSPLESATSATPATNATTQSVNHKCPRCDDEGCDHCAATL